MATLSELQMKATFEVKIPKHGVIKFKISSFLNETVERFIKCKGEPRECFVDLLSGLVIEPKLNPKEIGSLTDKTLKIIGLELLKHQGLLSRYEEIKRKKSYGNFYQKVKTLYKEKRQKVRILNTGIPRMGVFGELERLRKSGVFEKMGYVSSRLSTFDHLQREMNKLSFGTLSAVDHFQQEMSKMNFGALSAVNRIQTETNKASLGALSAADRFRELANISPGFEELQRVVEANKQLFATTKAWESATGGTAFQSDSFRKAWESAIGVDQSSLEAIKRTFELHQKTMKETMFGLNRDLLESIRGMTKFAIDTHQFSSLSNITGHNKLLLDAIEGNRQNIADQLQNFTNYFEDVLNREDIKNRLDAEFRQRIGRDIETVKHETELLRTVPALSPHSIAFIITISHIFLSTYLRLYQKIWNGETIDEIDFFLLILDISEALSIYYFLLREK